MPKQALGLIPIRSPTTDPLYTLQIPTDPRIVFVMSREKKVLIAVFCDS